MSGAEQAIREKAYALWEKEGSPAGRDREFWERARLMIEAEHTPQPTTTTPSHSEEDKRADKAVEDTFPASDPPSFTATSGTKAE